MHIKFLTAAITLPELKKPDAGEDMAEEVQSMLQELQQLHSFLDTRYDAFVPYFLLVNDILIMPQHLRA